MQRNLYEAYISDYCIKCPLLYSTWRIATMILSVTSSREFLEFFAPYYHFSCDFVPVVHHPRSRSELKPRHLNGFMSIELLHDYNYIHISMLPFQLPGVEFKQPYTCWRTPNRNERSQPLKLFSESMVQ